MAPKRVSFAPDARNRPVGSRPEDNRRATQRSAWLSFTLGPERPMSIALPWEAGLVDNVSTPMLEDRSRDRYSTYFHTARPAYPDASHPPLPQMPQPAPVTAPQLAVPQPRESSYMPRFSVLDSMPSTRLTPDYLTEAVPKLPRRNPTRRRSSVKRESSFEKQPPQPEATFQPPEIQITSPRDSGVQAPEPTRQPARQSARQSTRQSYRQSIQSFIDPWLPQSRKAKARESTRQSQLLSQAPADRESVVSYYDPWSHQARRPATRHETSLDGLTEVDSQESLGAEKDPQIAAAAEGPVDPMDLLPPDEAETLKRQIEMPEKKYGFLTMYRYASGMDIFILVISSICAIAAGAAMPAMTIIFGKLQGVFQDYFLGVTDYDGFKDDMTDYVLYFVYLGIGTFFATYITMGGYMYTGEHIASKIREHYLQSCLRQNIGYFDKLGSGEVVNRITADTNTIQDGISERVSMTIQAIATFLTAFVIGFIFFWKLTLILLSVVVALLLNTSIGSKIIMRYNTPTLTAYIQGATLIDEVFSSIRNAVAFGTQEHLAKQYDEHLKNSEKYGFKVKHVASWMIAMMMGLLYLNFALAYWQGGRFLLSGDVKLNEVLTVLMAVMLGAFNMGGIAPNIQAFTQALATSNKLFQSIDRRSAIDPSDNRGQTLINVKGNIRLQNIKHIYPSRPGVVVMDNVTLDIPAGKTTALVGASGCGKSTIIGLVERFYDPVQGQIFLDGHDITCFNLRWLRQQMSLVSQEPQLFGTTVFENIAHGLVGTHYEYETEELQRELVVDAAKKANAHDFITELSEGYETHVGDGGFLMSGGQKQRIAIARAIVSNPKILLLDEATSALDTKSEGVVQAALDAASAGRTTITIAHRLSTIRNADNIVVMSEGKIVESGTHNELLNRGGAYTGLVASQDLKRGDSDEEEKDSELEVEEFELRRRRQEHRRRLSDRQSQRQSRWTDAFSGRFSGATSARFGSDFDEEVSSRMKRRTQMRPDSTAMALEAAKPEPTKKYGLWELISFVSSFNRGEKMWMVIGIIWSVICGGGSPVGAVFFAKQVTTLSRPITPETKADIREDNEFWSVMYVMLAGVQILAYGFQGLAFSKCSEALIRRVRDNTFRVIMRQDASFFDKEENNPGALTSFLAVESTQVAGLSGATLSVLVTAMTTLIGALAMSIAIGWKLALVCASTIPVLLACGFFRVWLLARFQKRSKGAYAESAGFASEAVAAIKTVASLTREEQVFRNYHQALEAQRMRSVKSMLKSTAVFSLSQSLLFLCFALGFWYGGTLIAEREYNQFQFFLCFMGVVYGSQSAGTFFSFAPDMGKAHQSAVDLKTLFDRQPVVDTWSMEGQRIASLDGHVEFRDVHFRYPTRPERPILRGIDMDIRPGQYVAIVGGSGSGKSTCISLMERFYDPMMGGVYVDGMDITDMNINDYRSQIALVSQEPTLYQGSIRYNIVLGSGKKEVSDKALEAACREANIWDFVVSLPDGFDTVLGPKGGMLSGGQKQRIAIARALIRNPRILLLDEATSALDSESEAVVQKALDEAAKGRTTITVAHRLSTIQKADCIYVLDQGRVVERGNHSELMRKNGRYAELVNLQSLEG